MGVASYNKNGGLKIQHNILVDVYLSVCLYVSLPVCMRACMHVHGSGCDSKCCCLDITLMQLILFVYILCILYILKNIIFA